VIVVPDVLVCLDNDQNSGYCNKTITKLESDITGQTWIAFKDYSVKLHVNDWSRIKAFIIKICKTTKQCDISVKK
jgi:hypothetical protein